MVRMMSDELDTRLHLRLPNELGCEKVVRGMLARILAEDGFDVARIADLQTAVSEACINAIEHGNQGRAECNVSIIIDVTPDHVEAIISDEGLCPARSEGHVAASIEQKVAGLAPARGMGLMLISQLVDEAGFLPAQPGAGNRFRLRVYRQVCQSSSCREGLDDATS